MQDQIVHFHHAGSCDSTLRRGGGYETACCGTITVRTVDLPLVPRITGCGIRTQTADPGVRLIGLHCIPLDASTMKHPLA